jgi:hypothetical protein
MVRVCNTAVGVLRELSKKFNMFFELMLFKNAFFVL